MLSIFTLACVAGRRKGVHACARLSPFPPLQTPATQAIFTHVIIMLRDTHSEPGLPVLSVVDDIFFGGLAVVQEFFGEPGYLYGRKHLLDIFFPKAPHARFIFGSFFATQEFFWGRG